MYSEPKRSWVGEALLKILTVCDLNDQQKSVLMQTLLAILAPLVLIYDIYQVATGQANPNRHLPFFVPMVLIVFIFYIRKMDQIFAQIEAEQAKDPSAQLFRD